MKKTILIMTFEDILNKENIEKTIRPGLFLSLTPIENTDKYKYRIYTKQEE